MENIGEEREPEVIRRVRGGPRRGKEASMREVKEGVGDRFDRGSRAEEGVVEEFEGEERGEATGGKTGG